MRRLLLLGLVLVPPAWAHGVVPVASQGGCGPFAAHTIKSNSVARVYSSNGSVYGCSVKSRKRVRLGGSKSCLGGSLVAPVALSGPVVAYGLQRCGVDTGFASVVVRRVTNGHKLSEDAATQTALPPESYESVGSLVVRSDGAVAWIGVAYSIVSSQKGIEVNRRDRRGTALLDAGRSIAPKSLRRHGSRISWKRGGRVHSATLL